MVSLTQQGPVCSVSKIDILSTFIKVYVCVYLCGEYVCVILIEDSLYDVFWNICKISKSYVAPRFF